MHGRDKKYIRTYVTYIVEKLEGREQRGESGADGTKILKPNLPEKNKV
jgi:hypothetical protein